MDGLLQAFVRIRHDEADAVQPALDEAPEKRRPKGAVLGRAHVEAQHLAVSVGGDADRDHRRLATRKRGNYPCPEARRPRSVQDGVVQSGARRHGIAGIHGKRGRGFCKLQNPKDPIGFESHPLRH
jgi:hypothetical protein